MSSATNIPDDHPRAHSLRTRERMNDAYEQGLIHGTGLIAHGRGEAFDYLLGEKTPPETQEAIAHAAHLLRQATHPVLSLNGNVVALAASECVALQEALPGLVLEVNLFHRSPERIAKLVAATEAAGATPGSVLGEDADARIPGLTSDRALCCQDGIGDADVVLVPLEDGDRCEALKAMGKTVITIDLNPLSRTARTADVTIVDELRRALDHLRRALSQDTEGTHKGAARGSRHAEGQEHGNADAPGYDNADVLRRVRHRMAKHLEAEGLP